MDLVQECYSSVQGDPGTSIRVLGQEREGTRVAQESGWLIPWPHRGRTVASVSELLEELGGRAGGGGISGPQQEMLQILLAFATQGLLKDSQLASVSHPNPHRACPTLRIVAARRAPAARQKSKQNPGKQVS